MERPITRTIHHDNVGIVIITSNDKTCIGCEQIRTFVYPWKILWMKNSEFLFSYCGLFGRKATDPCNPEEFGALPEPLEYNENEIPLRCNRCLSREMKRYEEDKEEH